MTKGNAAKELPPIPTEEGSAEADDGNGQAGGADDGLEDVINEDSASRQEYPPGTYSLLSWSAIEFIQAPTVRFFGWTVIFITGAMVAAMILSSFVKIDIAIESEGEVTSNVGVREVVSPTEGLVTQVTKHIGDNIKEGEVLAKLAVDGVTERELLGVIADLNTALDRIEKSQNALFLNLGSLNLPVNKIYDSNVTQNLVGVEQNLRNFQEQQKATQIGLHKEIDPLENRIVLLNGKINKMKKSRQREFLKFYADSMDDEIGKLKVQVAATRNQALGKFNQSLTDLVHSMRLATSSLQGYYDKHLIRSPITGTIAKLDVASNSHIAANKLLAMILPLNSQFVARLKVPSKDIVKIHPGETVLYKVEAYPYQQYGLFTGEVESFDQFKTEQPANQAGTSQAQAAQGDYVVMGSVSPPSGLSPATRDQIKFFVGMTLNGRIVIDRKPLSRVLFEKLFSN